MMPCKYCAGLILNSDAIDEVYWAKSYRIDDGVGDLIEGGIITQSFEALMNAKETDK